jgi:hypothetical protein
MNNPQGPRRGFGIYTGHTMAAFMRIGMANVNRASFIVQSISLPFKIVAGAKMALLTVRRQEI